MGQQNRNLKLGLPYFWRTKCPGHWSLSVGEYRLSSTPWEARASYSRDLASWRSKSVPETGADRLGRCLLSIWVPGFFEIRALLPPYTGTLVLLREIGKPFGKSGCFDFSASTLINYFCSSMRSQQTWMSCNNPGLDTASVLTELAEDGLYVWQSQFRLGRRSLNLNHFTPLFPNLGENVFEVFICHLCYTSTRLELRPAEDSMRLESDVRIG